MKGIYLTEEGKKAIEDKIDELKNQEEFGHAYYILYGTIETLDEILSSATIIPVEEDWGKIIFNEEYQIGAKKNYQNGVIIQPKNLLTNLI
jgi:hypothetical protein